MKYNKPIVSVIVPIYKVEKYLVECIESIRSQTFSEIEIILVDDGSPDRCGIICDEYANIDERIKVIHQDNLGLSQARNSGVREAKGDFICFVDSDDIISNEYCEKLYNLLNNSEYDFSVCGVSKFADGTTPKIVKKGSSSYVLSNKDYLCNQLNKKTEFGVWNKLYRKELFSKISFEANRLHEDVIWAAELADKLNSKVIITNENLYFYRQRDGGIVSESSKMCSADFIYAGNKIITVCKRKYPELLDLAVQYTIRYPWGFVDKIYLSKKCSENILLLKSLQNTILQYTEIIKKMDYFSIIVKKRMLFFSKSLFLYNINVNIRLIRLYIYRILRKNPYKNDHGI